MVVECEKRGATAEMGKEEKEKRKFFKKNIKIFLIVLTQHNIYIYIYIIHLLLYIIAEKLKILNLTPPMEPQFCNWWCHYGFLAPPIIMLINYFYFFSTIIRGGWCFIANQILLLLSDYMFNCCLQFWVLIFFSSSFITKTQNIILSFCT